MTNLTWEALEAGISDLNRVDKCRKRDFIFVAASYKEAIYADKTLTRDWKIYRPGIVNKMSLGEHIRIHRR